jgi:hypothetical protein
VSGGYNQAPNQSGTGQVGGSHESTLRRMAPSGLDGGRKVS